MRAERTFPLTLESAEFICDELATSRDDVIRELRDWCDAERREREEEAERRRFAPGVVFAYDDSPLGFGLHVRQPPSEGWLR